MIYRNKICPYACQPISSIEVSCEHIVPDALGGPATFALAADKTHNSVYGASVDIRLIRSPLMGMIAARAGVETRSGPSTWKTQGHLVADGSPVELVGSKDAVAFRFLKPVEVDPVTRRVQAIKGFGADVDKELARVTKDLKRKGWDLTPTGHEVLDSNVRGSFEHNLSEATQGLTKIAYLATVWAVGDRFINTEAGAQYRRWLSVEPTVNALEAAELRPLGGSLFKAQGTPTQHHIACVVSGQTVLTGVRLFNEPLFEIAIAVEVPELQLPEDHGHLVIIDAVAKTFEEQLLIP
ncbi:hypothetical protein [Comamonas guangdongensis]|uniref:HNH endonuclease n=1 Tax=Comamonas guangdongensis TaxID=510515 RepID=A0ABV4A1M2_9BURK